MAEGFLRKFAPNYEVQSAGTKPQIEINPTVIEAMNEIGIDISKQKPKALTNELIAKSITVNMGCMDQDSCPALFMNDVVDWKISDPKGKNLDQIREIRDQIKKNVLDLIKQLES